jgi:hypothetical protein
MKNIITRAAGVSGRHADTQSADVTRMGSISAIFVFKGAALRPGFVRN